MSSDEDNVCLQWFQVILGVSRPMKTYCVTVQGIWQSEFCRSSDVVCDVLAGTLST